MKNRAEKSLSGGLVAAMLLTAVLSSVRAAEQTTAQRMTHHRAIDAAVWAMPLMNFKLDGNIYREIHEMINEEVVLERDLSMMGLLARIGIRKGEPFTPDAELQAVFDKAGPEALEFMIDQYHRVLNPFIYKGKKWSALVPNGSRETDWTFEYPSYYDYHARPLLWSRTRHPRREL